MHWDDYGQSKFICLLHVYFSEITSKVVLICVHLPDVWILCSSVWLPCNGLLEHAIILVRTRWVLKNQLKMDIEGTQ